MTDKQQPDTYTIRIKGHLSDQWAARFEGMSVTRTEDGDTQLKGDIADQAALHGLLRTVRDCGLELLSLQRINKE